MTFNVHFISYAEEDLFNIYKYVRQNDSEENADNLYLKLQEKCITLRQYPNSGHILKEFTILGVEEFLEINYKPYRIIYQIIENNVYIHCILDGRRDMQRLLQERL